jgi:hypothetical protein
MILCNWKLDSSIGSHLYIYVSSFQLRTGDRDPGIWLQRPGHQQKRKNYRKNGVWKNKCIYYCNLMEKKKNPDLIFWWVRTWGITKRKKRILDRAADLIMTVSPTPKMENVEQWSNALHSWFQSKDAQIFIDRSVELQNGPELSTEAWVRERKLLG